ncbi:hypothetical protein FZ983_17715 [Azospirillum sp. B21]|nr:hypothetical protein FZ983_17715 [Azospirillum sp. B21]
MTKQASPKYAPEVRERPVRMVFEHEGEHASHDLAPVRWTPLLSSEWSGKVSDDEDKAILHGRVQA